MKAGSESMNHMNEAAQEFSKSILTNADCPAINVPSFFMKRMSVSNPKPTQYYHYHDCYEMYYLYSGERYYFIKDKTYHLKTGAFVFIEPYTIHCSSNFKKSGYDRIVLYFKKDFVDELLRAVGASESFDKYSESCHVLMLDSCEQRFVEALYETMLQEYAAAPSEAYLKTSLVQLLLFIGKSEYKLEAPPLDYANPTHKMISEITGYINNNYTENITLSHISNRFHISPCYFSRTFKSLKGHSFTEYLNNVRIKEARNYLEKTDMSILHIAQATGFDGNTHFGRVFKKIVGVSPLSYRKSVQKK